MVRYSSTAACTLGNKALLLLLPVEAYTLRAMSRQCTLNVSLKPFNTRDTAASWAAVDSSRPGLSSVNIQRSSSLPIFPVGHGGGITQKYVLAQVVADDSPVETSQCQVAVDYRKGAVLYLLQQVILTVGLVDFRHTVYLVDGSHVEIRVESFVGQCQGYRILRLGISMRRSKSPASVPAAYVHSGTTSPGLNLTGPLSGRSRRYDCVPVPSGHRPCGSSRAIRGIFR